jgi:Arc/MetJ family transcription regulator
MPRTGTIPAAAFAACAVLWWSIAAPTAAHADDLLKARVAQNLGPISAS